MQCVQYIKVDVCRQLGKRDKTAEWFQFGWRQQLLLYDCRQICRDPPWASDQLLCHRCLYHADRDWYPGIRFLGIPLAKKRESPIFQTFGKLEDLWKAIWLFYCVIHESWRRCAISTHKEAPAFPSFPFDSCWSSASSVKCTMKVL